jgi:hypothetical protein
MSQLGQTLHFYRVPATSGLPLATDIARPARLVRFVPKTDMERALFNHIVCDGEQPRRHLDVEHSRRLQVDDELEFGRLLDR